MEYTEGEWKAKKNWMGTWTIYTDDAHIADVDRHFNAHLIAAAPIGDELASAVIDMEFDTYDDSPELVKLLEIARKFKLKAEGK